MLKSRKQAFETVQPLFQAAEIATDHATAESASCIAEMLRARANANLPIATGKDMFETLVKAFNANADARRLFIEAHEMTPALVKEMGLERAFGDVFPCPPTDPRRQNDGLLTIVPLEAAG